MPIGPSFFPSNRKEDEPEPAPEFTQEEINIFSWRIAVLVREGGFDTFYAGRLAAIHDLDWRRAVRLRRQGCKQELVEEILR